MSLDETRELGIRAINTVLTEKKNCKVFEKYIYRSSPSEDWDTYIWFIYQIIGALIADKTRMKKILKAVKKGRVGWKSPVYDEVKERLDEHDSYIVTPFEVADGVVECPKCHKSRTWSIQKQTRSSDEPMTTFSKCVECGNEWTYSG
jgi:DNA-directed RNA polymerase subunit M/transcription elongation factor TFIIS